MPHRITQIISKRQGPTVSPRSRVQATLPGLRDLEWMPFPKLCFRRLPSSSSKSQPLPGIVSQKKKSTAFKTRDVHSTPGYCVLGATGHTLYPSVAQETICVRGLFLSMEEELDEFHQKELVLRCTEYRKRSRMGVRSSVSKAGGS